MSLFQVVYILRETQLGGKGLFLRPIYFNRKTCQRKFNNTRRKNGFTESQRWSQPLTRDKCLPLPAVSGESSGDKGRFCHAFNSYLWLASNVYLISIGTPVKDVLKYVWDLSQRCGNSASKLCLTLKSKACQRSGQMASAWSLGQGCAKGVI